MNQDSRECAQKSSPSELGSSFPDEFSNQVQMLLTQLMPYVRGLARRFGLNDCDTTDVMQEALLAFCLYRTRIEDPRKWLMTVLRNECLRLLRGRASQAVRLEDLPESRIRQLSPCSISSLHERLRLGKLVSDLSSRNRRVLWMRFVADMSWIEIAENLSCSPGGAKKAVFRAVAAARGRASALQRVGPPELLVEEG